MAKKASATREPKVETSKATPDRVNPVIIDGTTFVKVEHASFEQDMHMFDLVEKMGLSEIDIQTILNTKLTTEVNKIMLQAYRSGVMFEMLGTAMVEKGKEEDWSPEVAAEVGEIFRQVRDPEVRQTLERNTVFLLLSFFVSGLFLSETSQNFSMRELAEQALAAGKESLSEDRGEPSNSETGNRSSERSQVATLIAQSRLSSGRSVKDS